MDKLTFSEAIENIKNTNDTARTTIEVATMLSDIIFELSEARIKQGLSQRDLAEKSGIKQSAIARMESLSAIPRLDTLVKIARCLNMRVSIAPAISRGTVKTGIIAFTTQSGKEQYKWRTESTVKAAVYKGTGENYAAIG